MLTCGSCSTSRSTATRSPGNGCVVTLAITATNGPTSWPTVAWMKCAGTSRADRDVWRRSCRRLRSFDLDLFQTAENQKPDQKIAAFGSSYKDCVHRSAMAVAREHVNIRAFARLTD